MSRVPDPDSKWSELAPRFVPKIPHKECHDRIFVARIMLGRYFRTNGVNDVAPWPGMSDFVL